MGDNARRALLSFIPAALAGGVIASAMQQTHPPPTDPAYGPGHDEEIRLPNGKLQRDAILEEEFKSNLKDAHTLTELAQSFEHGLEKSYASVLNLDLLKQLDELDKITRRIRGRMRR